MSVPFNTWEVRNRLVDAGMPAQQAEAVVYVMVDIAKMKEDKTQVNLTGYRSFVWHTAFAVALAAFVVIVGAQLL